MVLVRTQSLSRDVWLWCFSAFSVDLGSQGVTAPLPLHLVFELRDALRAYGAVTALAFWGGAFIGSLGVLPAFATRLQSTRCPATP